MQIMGDIHKTQVTQLCSYSYITFNSRLKELRLIQCHDFQKKSNWTVYTEIHSASV